MSLTAVCRVAVDVPPRVVVNSPWVQYTDGKERSCVFPPSPRRPID